MSVLGRSLSFYLPRIDLWLVRSARHPAAAQRRIFKKLLRRARNTWFGREHGFKSIRTHEDFVRQVPIRDYVAQLEMFERIVGGQRDVSWPGRVRYFAQTSGTTAGDKRIPVTRGMMRANARAALAIFAYYRRRSPALLARMLEGRLLFLGGSTDLTRTDSGALIGDLSGIATRSIRWPVKAHYEPGGKLAVIGSWEEKVQRVAERVAGRDLRFATGMPSWMMVLFRRVCRIRGVDPEGGISRIWPNLQLFVHGGVNFAPYRPTFRRFFQPDHPLDFLEVYTASEGFVAVQSEPGDPAMEVLTANGLFYEFVPLSEWGRPDAPRLTIEQVERDVPYSVVLSTCAGLWAYDLGDVVRFTSLKPPRVLFAGRNRHFINAFGENIIGEQVSAAVAAAAAQSGAEVAEFTAAPRYADANHPVGAHQYVVEFDVPPQAGIDAFAAAVDAELQRTNNDYSVNRRGDLGMTCVEVTAVPKGTFYEWMKRRGKLGGQNKVPVCANGRKYVDDLLPVVEHAHTP
ncbi:MAG TPA: GH3 auxin-responsive promoter family protein [Phycisphaerae bacterium]|nr:GH3 auxin-responsive promoter family protein [Phycisphaerae bacterium]